MSSDNNEILIKALEASGSEREAKLARAILGEAPAVEAPAIPDVQTPPSVQQAAATLTSREDVERLPQREFEARYGEVQAALAAQGGIQAGGVTAADLRQMTAAEISKLPQEAVAAALKNGRS